MLSILLAILATAPSLLPLLDDALVAAPSLEGIAAAIGTEGALKVIGGITLAQWIPIVEEFAAAAPAAQKFYAAVHPAFAELAADIEKGLDRHDSAANINAWFKANQPKTISGYGADGGVTQIPNPDTTEN